MARIMGGWRPTRQCISATVGPNYCKLDNANPIAQRALCRTFAHPYLSTHLIEPRRLSLPSFADMLVLYGRGDCAPWPVGWRHFGNRPVFAMQSVGHGGFRSSAGELASWRALVAALVFFEPCHRQGRMKALHPVICLQIIGDHLGIRVIDGSPHGVDHLRYLRIPFLWSKKW